MKMLLTLMVGSFLVSCSVEDPLVDEAKQAVLHDLRDPGSAEFRNVAHCAKPDGIMGEVNSRNAYGGFAGFEPFIYVRGHGAQILEGHGSAGSESSVYAAEYELLSRLCYSDAVLRQSDAEQANFMNSLNAMAPPSPPAAPSVPSGDARDFVGDTDPGGSPVVQPEPVAAPPQRAMEGQAGNVAIDRPESANSAQSPK